MKDGKISYRSLAVILAVVMIFSSAVGGTIAWLIAKTDTVVNTFTYGDIDLVLEETKVDKDGNPVDKDGDGNPDKTDDIENGNTYEMIPGEEYLKDPEVTVEADNEECWLFVKLEETEGFDNYLTYEVLEEWNQLKDTSGTSLEGIYYRRVGEDTDGQAVSYKILKEDKITVKEDVTKEMLNELDDNGETAETAIYPTLSVTAYAVQYSGFEVDETQGVDENAAALSAWEAVENHNSTP